MKNKLRKYAVALMLGLMTTSVMEEAGADVPATMSIQGILKDINNVSMPDSTYSVTFRIYSLAGQVIWSEVQSVATVGGLFTTILGSVTPIPVSTFGSTNRRLGIEVQSYPEMTPRIQLTSVPFANEAARATNLDVNGLWTGEQGALDIISGDKATITMQSGPVAGDKKWMLHVGSNGPGNLEFWKRDPAQWTHVMGLSQSGNVGIGTTNPQMPLQIGDVGVLGATGIIRLESRAAGFPHHRSWEIGVPQTGEDASGKGYSFVIDDRQFGTDPEMFVQWGTGRVGIGTLEPTEQLEVAGNIKSGGRHVPVGEESIRIIRGVVTNLGAIFAGSGFQVTRTNTGRYTVTFDTPFAGTPAVTATPTLSELNKLIQTQNLAAGSVLFHTVMRSDGSYTDESFSFIAIGPR